jgi:hypothetical protein
VLKPDADSGLWSYCFDVDSSPFRLAVQGVRKLVQVGCSNNLCGFCVSDVPCWVLLLRNEALVGRARASREEGTQDRSVVFPVADSPVPCN